MQDGVTKWYDQVPSKSNWYDSVPAKDVKKTNDLIEGIPDKINEVAGKLLLKKAGYVFVAPETVVTEKPPTMKDVEKLTTEQKTTASNYFKKQQDIGANENYKRLEGALDVVEGIASPITDAVKGFGEGVKRTVQGGQEVAQGKVGEGLLDAGLGVVQSGFSGVSLAVPEIAAINLGFKGAGVIAPEKVMEYVGAPVSTLAKDLGVSPDSELGKKSLETLDVVAQVAAFKGMSDLAGKLSTKAEIARAKLRDANGKFVAKQTEIPQIETPIDNNANAIKRLSDEGKTPEEISKGLNIPVEEVNKTVNSETPKRFISDESYQTAKKNLYDKGLESLKKNPSLLGGLDPTMLKDLTIIGAYHLENIARAGIEKGKEFAEFSKRMIAELGQDVKPHLLRIYNSTVKEHQQTLEKLRTLPEGTPGKPDLHFGGVDPRIKPEVQEFYDTHKAEYDQFRGGKIGNKQLINQGLKYASKLTDEDILSMKSRKGIGEVEAVGSHIYGQSRIEQLIGEMNKIELGTQEGFSARKAKVDLAAEIFYNIENPYSRAGRQLQVKGKLATDNFIDALRKLRDEAEKFNPELAKDLTNKLRGAEYEPTLKDKLAFWYYNSLLSDPTTDIRNITGNTTMLVAEVLSKSFSPNIKETLKMMGDIGKGARSGLKEMSDLYHQRISEDSKFINTTNRYDVKAKTQFGKFGRALLPTTRLSMEDTFFRGIAREMSKGKVERVTSKTFGQSLKITQEQIGKVLQGDLDNLTGAQINFIGKGLDYIERYTDYTTFRTELGKIGSGVEGIVRNSWAAKMIMPFVKVSANIIRVGTDYSPLGFGKEALMRLKGGELNPFELKDIRRRAIAGTLAIGVVVNGVANGSIEVTGQLPSNAFEREAMQAKGYQPNHIYLNFGGKKMGISYQNINPINIPLSIIGNYSDNLRFGKEIKKQDELSFGDKMGKAILGSAATIADQSYMQGINNLLDAMQKQDPGYFSDIAVGFIPNIVGLPKKVLGDNISYKAKTLEEKVKRKIGITEGLEPNIDIKGEEKTTQLRGLPLPVSTVKKDDVLDYLKEKDLRIALPSPNTKLEDEKLTPRQYTLYQKIVNKNVYKRLNELLPLIKTMSLEEAQNLIDQVSNEEKQTAKELLKFN